MRAVVIPVLLLAAMRLPAADPGPGLRFVDVRLQAGVDGGIDRIDGADARARGGAVGALTIMAGRIGDHGDHDDGPAWRDWLDDVGWVVGARCQAARWQGDPASNPGQRRKREGYGVAAVGGLAFAWSADLHLELCGLYGMGVSSSRSIVHGSIERDGDLRWYGLELGTYYTWGNRAQTGFIVGIDRVRIDAPVAAQGPDVAWRAGGLAAAVTLGWRF